MAAISAVFTIGYVAAKLGEDEDWLHELSINMFPEDGCLHVYGLGDDGVTVFTEYGDRMPPRDRRWPARRRERLAKGQISKIELTAVLTE